MTRADLSAVIGDAREILAIASKMPDGSVARRAIELRIRKIISRCDLHLAAYGREHEMVVELSGDAPTARKGRE